MIRLEHRMLFVAHTVGHLCLVGLGGCGPSGLAIELAVAPKATEGCSCHERRAQSGERVVWVQDRLVPEKGTDGSVLVLRGRASGSLVGGRGGSTPRGGNKRYGTWRQPGAQEFSLSWSTNEAAALVRGGGALFALTFAPGDSQAPETIHGRVAIRPRLVSTIGGPVYLYPDLVPVIHTGRTVYRLSGYTLDSIWALSVRLAGRVLTSIQRPDATRFYLDLRPEEVVEAATAGNGIALSLHLPDGPRRVPVAVELSVDTLELTNDEPAAVWPEPACSEDVRACLSFLPPVTLDLAACGEAPAVEACAGGVGLRVRQADIQAARQEAYLIVDQRLGRDGDATVLVGRARANALIAATKERVAQRLQAWEGRWLISSPAVEKALRAETTALVDEAYAMPLRLVPPLVPTPGEPQSARDAVADALLHYLAGRDLVDTEYDRTLTDLTARYRQHHIAAIRYFREQATPRDWLDQPGWDEYQGRWLGAVVWIRVDRATGEAAVVEFEID